jgi:hypothetical protein
MDEEDSNLSSGSEVTPFVFLQSDWIAVHVDVLNAKREAETVVIPIESSFADLENNARIAFCVKTNHHIEFVSSYGWKEEAVDFPSYAGFQIPWDTDKKVSDIGYIQFAAIDEDRDGYEIMEDGVFHVVEEVRYVTVIFTPPSLVTKTVKYRHALCMFEGNQDDLVMAFLKSVEESGGNIPGLSRAKNDSYQLDRYIDSLYEEIGNTYTLMSYLY